MKGTEHQEFYLNYSGSEEFGDDNHAVENECADPHINLVGIGMPSPRPPKVPPCESACQ
jgi:hypothetical protein